METKLMGAAALVAVMAAGSIPAAAQAVIDTGPVATAFTFTAAIDTSGTDTIFPLPLLNSYLGSLSSVDFTAGGTFSWPNPVYTINDEPLPGHLGTETATLTYHTGSYILGGSDLPTSIEADSAICADSPAGHCLSGSFPFAPVNRTIPDQTVTGTVAMTGSKEMTVDVSSSFSGKGSFSSSGNFTIDGTATVDIKYTSLSNAKYLQEAIDHAGNGSDALKFITELRNLDAGTSATNLTLRDAQYTLYGYNSGSRLAQALLAGDLSGARDALGAAGNGTGSGFASPGAAAVYLAMKAAGEAGCKSCADFVASLGNPSLPGSPADARSFLANVQGFEYGLTYPLAISGLPSAVSFVLASGSADPFSPTGPLATVAAGSDGSPSMGMYAFSATAGADTYIDPSGADLIAISIIGAGISGFEIPFIDGQQDISGAMLEVNGKTVAILGDEWYDLNSLFGFAPQTILLTGIEGALVPDELVFGFRFDQTAAIGMVSIGAVASGVPEVSTWVMMIIGFAGLGYTGFKRSSKPRLA